MGKHEISYPRVDRDFYPTPDWVVEALAEHLDLAGRSVWEPAAGDGRMSEALKVAGATVYSTDIADRGFSDFNGTFDFLSDRNPVMPRFDLIVTNPPFGQGGKLAVGFIEAGLQRIADHGTLALLLPVDFDSAKTRAHLFADCPHFLGKIILRRRIVWFERTDGKHEAPKENHAWFTWSRPLLKTRQPPLIMYAPATPFPRSPTLREKAGQR
jgi:hypothetical protein